jgi:DNA topoisomerase-1
MTAELEDDMDKIASGQVTKDEVLDISRKMLRESYDLMNEHKQELAEIIWEGMNQDRILGPCPQCREAGRTNEQGEINRLRIIRARKSGKRFVGCEGYPDCDQTYGIPQRGDLIRLEEVCSICGKTPRLKVLSGRRPWNLCLNEECPSMEEMRAARAEREAAKAAKEAAAEVEAAEAASGDGEVKVTKPKRKTKTPAKS